MIASELNRRMTVLPLLQKWTLWFAELRRTLQRGGAKPANSARLGKSIALRIGALYVLFSLISLTVFSLLVFQNQANLLNENFTNESRKLADSFQQRVGDLKIGENIGAAISSALTLSGFVEHCFVTTAPSGSMVCKAAPENAEQLRIRTARYRLQAEAFQIPVIIEANARGFGGFISASARTGTGDSIFFTALLDGERIRRGFRELYYQAATLLVFGVCLNVAFGFFFYRILFKRLSSLETASRSLSHGKLETRVDWPMPDGDELDSLGAAFNNMAERIQVTVDQVRKMNAEMAQELEVGRVVQGMLLSDLKPIKELKPALAFRPMREVSGDFYGFVNHNAGFKTIFLGDATGHGVSAALVTTSVMMLLERILETTRAPGKILQQLNVALANKLNSEFFVTAFCALVHPNGRLYYANAGHNPPVLLSSRRNTRAMLKADSPPLGVPVEFEVGTYQLPFVSGDKLLIYTDGLIEVTNEAGAMLDLRPVVDIFAQRFHEPNEVILEAIMAHYDAFRTDQRDDTTALLLEAP